MHGNPAFFNICLLFFCTFYGNYLKYTKTLVKLFQFC